MIIVLHSLLQVLFVIRVLLRPNREPTSRLAWMVVILAVPVLGMVAYLLLGETRMGWRRLAQHEAAKERLPGPEDMASQTAAIGQVRVRAAEPICRVVPRRPVDQWFCSRRRKHGPPDGRR